MEPSQPTEGEEGKAAEKPTEEAAPGGSQPQSTPPASPPEPSPPPPSPAPPAPMIRPAPPPPPPPPPPAGPRPWPQGVVSAPRPQVFQPPSVVARLDALPKEAMKSATVAMVWFVLSALIFLAIGGYLHFILNDALSTDKPIDESAMMSYISVLYVFGALAILLAAAVGWKVRGAMKADRWDTAVDSSMLIGMPGFIFGLGLSGVLLFRISKKMRTHPFYLRTLPPPTPVCERCRQKVEWNAQYKKYYCANCRIYL